MFDAKLPTIIADVTIQQKLLIMLIHIYMFAVFSGRRSGYFVGLRIAVAVFTALLLQVSRSAQKKSGAKNVA